MTGSYFPLLVRIISELDLLPLVIKRIYPAPPAIGSITLDIETLPVEDLLKHLSSDEVWQAANSFLRSGEFSLAYKYYSHLQKEKPDQTIIIALRGLSLVCLGEIRKGGNLISRALVQNPELDLARLWLGYIRLLEKKPKGLRHQLDLLHKNSERSDVRAMAYLIGAVQYALEGKLEVAELEIRQSLLLNDEHYARYILASLGFVKGREHFESGNYKEGLSTWASYAADAGDAWSSISALVNYFSSIEGQSFYISALDKARKEARLESLDSVYWYVSMKLLGLGLLPEFFEGYDNLNEREKEWKAKSRESAKYPYAHYRFALCLAYQGKYRESYEEFLNVREKIPTSKLAFFRVEALIDWLRMETDTRVRSKGLSLAYSELNEEEWLNAGFSSEEAREWYAEGFNINEALTWKEEAKIPAKSAKRWKRIEAKPKDAFEWNQVFSDEPEAITFYAAGFRDPAVALEWRKHFSIPSEAWDCYNRDISERLKQDLPEQDTI